MAHTKEKNKINWDKYLVTPSADDWWWEGNQVLNFYPCDKDYRDCPTAEEFVNRHFKHAQVFNTDAALLKYCSDQVAIEGAYLEMGVCTGRTINFIAALNPEKRIYGFDSFEGVPENWSREDIHLPKGTFAFKDCSAVPPVLHNVRLIKGNFHKTLPEFRDKILEDQPIAFLHIDCDLYSSTKEVFDVFADHVIPGTIIVFDEFYNYPGSENHEFKAFQEFLQNCGKKANYIAYNQYFEQAAVRIM